MRLLVIDDEPRLARNIQRYLQSEERYTVELAFDGEEGLQKALAGEYDCVVLDVGLPGLDGFTVCKRLRDKGANMPILMLTAFSGKEPTVQGLDSGADDYMQKPFALEELCARIRALLRRTSNERNPMLQAGDVSLDPNTHSVRKGDKPVRLAPKEYALLEYLLRHKGVVQNRRSAIEHVWGEREETLFSQTLDVHVAYLRKKLGHDLIETVPGTGYLIPNN